MAIDTNQVLTLTVANLPTFTLLLLGILYNNARLNDLRDLLRAEMKFETQGVRGDVSGLRGEVLGLRGEFQVVRSEVNAEIRDVRATMEKYHNDVLRILADHDHRISRLEDKQ
jgi:hypothetical protein